MLATSRFLLWLPKPEYAEAPAAERRWRSAAGRAGLEPLAWGPLRLAVADPVHRNPARPPATAVLDAFPLRVPHLPTTQGAVDADWAEAHAQVFNLLRWDGRQLTLESDAVGLKPAYWAETAEGWLFGSTITDILVCEPSLAQPLDPIAVQFLFIGRATWEDRTLHQRVKRLASGAVYRWTLEGGLAVSRERRWALPEADPDMTFKSFSREMDAQASRLMDGMLAGNPEPLALSLSGGYDSRLLAAMTVERGHRPLSITFGAKHTREARAAAEIARLLGLPHRALPYRDDIILGQLDRLTGWLEGCCDLSTGQMSAVADFHLPPVRMIQGFAGDLIAGSFASRIRAGDDASHEAMARSILRHYRPTGPDLERLLGTPLDEAALVASIRADLGDDSAPVPAFWRWGWENHVRRYTAGILCASQPWADLLMPYYDREYVAFWSRVPVEGLVDRNWFKRWFAGRFPELGQVPHPEHHALIARQQPARALEWGEQRLFNMAARLFGSGGVEQFLRAIGRSSYIYDGPNLTSRRHQARLFEKLEEFRPALGRQLGVSLPPGFAKALPDRRGRTTQTARLLLALAAYAAHLQDALGAPGPQTLESRSGRADETGPLPASAPAASPAASPAAEAANPAAPQAAEALRTGAMPAAASPSSAQRA